MSVQAIEQVLERVVHEPRFRERIHESPVRALAGYSLTPEERTILLTDDARQREAQGIDHRISQIHIF